MKSIHILYLHVEKFTNRGISGTKGHVWRHTLLLSRQSGLLYTQAAGLHVTCHFHLFQATKKHTYVDELQSTSIATKQNINIKYVKAEISINITISNYSQTKMMFHCYVSLPDGIQTHRNGSTSLSAKMPSLCCALVLLQRARPALWTRYLVAALQHLRSAVFNGKTHELSTGPFSIAMWQITRGYLWFCFFAWSGICHEGWWMILDNWT